MSAHEVMTVWIDGPLHGSRRTWARTDVERSLGQEIVCGVPRIRSSAIYHVDSTIDDGQVHLRFVRIVPKRKITRTRRPQKSHVNATPKLRRHQFSLRAMLVLVTISCVVFGWLGLKERAKENARIRRSHSLTSELGKSAILYDGRDFHIRLLSNGNGRPSLALILSHVHVPYSSRVLQTTNTRDDSDPSEGFLSSWKIVRTGTNDDAEAGGLWIDGKKWVVDDSLKVVYISDKHPATIIPIPEEEQAAFIKDIENIQHLLPQVRDAFLEKWVTPHLLPQE
jgi:hypothetical protein